MNLKMLLEEGAEKHGGKTAVAMGDRRLSYAELDKASNKVANALTEMGVSKGDRVAMLLSNSPEFVTTYFGIVKLGAIAVPLDTKYKIGELSCLFDNSQPKVLITENQLLEPIVPALSEFKYIEHIIDKHESQFTSYRQIMATSSASKVKAEPKPEDVAHIAYTSGPSFQPKGVMLSHQGLVREAAISANGFQQTDRDVAILFALPMHHAFGLVVVLLTSLTKGSTIVILPGLSISNLIEVIERERGTMFMGVPFIYALMVNMAAEDGIKHDLSSLRLCASAGAAMPTKIIKQFKEFYDLDIIDFWGQTEATAHVTCQPLNGSGKPSSVGKVLPGWELKIVDDRGRELPSNQPGEIIVRGPIMAGFYNNPQATAEAIKEGWLHTGDIGRIDNDGYLFLSAGRKREMIIAKGQNIYLSDIKQILNTHPKVAEVTVLGVPDELRGETVKAVIGLKAGAVATEQEIKRFCLERLANYKVPREIIFTNSLPKATTDRKQQTR